MDPPIKELLCVHCSLQKVHRFNSSHYLLLLLFQIAVIQILKVKGKVKDMLKTPPDGGFIEEVDYLTNVFFYYNNFDNF